MFDVFDVRLRNHMYDAVKPLLALIYVMLIALNIKQVYDGW